MPRPTGWVPSVMTQRTWMSHASPTAANSDARRPACAVERTLAVGPTGISITVWVEPAAIFFDSTDAINWPSLSMSRARSTRISKSSAGLRLTAPPQARHAPVSPTTRRMSAISRVTGISVSTVPAVPDGDVIARDDVFGITRPPALAIATISGEVRLPGRPPMQCLS